MKKPITFFMSLVLILALILPMSTMVLADSLGTDIDQTAGEVPGVWPFTDVKEEPGNWIYDAARYVYDLGIMTGMGGTTLFNPAGVLSRGQFVTILYRMSAADALYKQVFPDVKESDWFGIPVAWCSETGVVTGYKNGLFGPGDDITREQLATMLYRYAKYDELYVSEKADLSGYPDAGKVSDWAKDAMEWAVGAGIVKGQDGGKTLDPQGKASRAECAAMIMRFIEETSELPSRFDLRDYGVVTSVKTQNPWQTCWAFSGIAAAESSILSMLKEKGQEVAAKDFDLSEKHLAWFATQPITKNTNPAQAGEGLYLFNDALNAKYDTGGMSLFVSTLFSTGVGPIYEKYFPYQGSSGLTEKEYIIQHPDETRKTVLEYVETTLLSGVTLKEIVENPDAEGARAYCEFLYEKGYLNKEEPLTVELLEEASFQMYVEEYAKTTNYTSYDDWTIPELGEDGNPNRNVTSGFTMVDGNILPNLINRDADGNWESTNWGGIQAVKKELLQGRAVSAGFKADVSAPGQGIPEKHYMDYNNWAHYTYEEVPASHAVCIIGWDDDYPAGNFQEGHQPAGNGAWLVKNSWGSETDYLDLREDAQIGKGEWGILDESGKHTGYFWISYYDKTLDNCETMSFDTVLTDAGGDLAVWMYDYMPAIVSADENTSMQSENLMKTANVFQNDTGIDVNLYAVSTKTASPDANVKYSIYQLNANAANPEDGTLLAAGEASFAYAGFHRVMLDSPVAIRDGETIAIVAEESIFEDGRTVYEYGVNVSNTEMKSKETGEPMYGVAVVNEGESFVFEDGVWTDWSRDERREALKEQYAIDNFSIKAYMIAG